MQHLHTHKTVWLCRCLTLILLLNVTAAGVTGWARALYLFSGDDGSAPLDESHTGIESTLLYLESGKSGENAMLTAGTLVTVRRGGETITATAQQETVKAFLQRMDGLRAGDGNGALSDRLPGNPVPAGGAGAGGSSRAGGAAHRHL